MPAQDPGGNSCLRCRSRKVRCDKARPRCFQCKQRSMECLFPDAPPRLLWLPSRTLDDFDLEQEQFALDMHVRRQPLFRGGQQARNADDLLSLTSGTSIGAAIEQLDYQADEISEDVTISNGPFHAFRCGHSNTVESVLSPLPPTEVLDLELWRLLANNLDEAVNEDTTTSFWLQDFCEPDELFATSEVETPTPSHLFLDQHSPEEHSAAGRLLKMNPSITSPPDLEDFAMSTAKLLLDHYRNITTTFYTPASVESKTPWEICYVPNVLSTLGEIALTGDSSDAKVSLLFAVFAISAFRLGILGSRDPSATQDWYALGNMYRQRATRRLQKTLRHLSSGLPKKEKYKNILMPLLSMVTICTVSGEMNNAAHYLRDIGQIIALYGIPKVQKSRKVQMLHSIYVYLRVLTEGIHFGNQSLVAVSETESTQQTPANWDILLGEMFSTYDTLNLDFLQCLAPPKSTFEQIYSIPDSLFKLILETTQLANEVEKLGHRIDIGNDSFAKKVKEHEAKICDWDQYYKETTYPADPTGAPPLKDRFPYHLMQAIYTALIIYFYRAVRDVNVMTLQPFVQQTIFHIKEYDKHKERHKDRSADICWPAFIAGCEATTPESRQEITEWLEKSTISNGMLMFKVALEAIQKVWTARKCPKKQNIAWHTVMRESSDMRVLVLS
ncbi:fungal-specific transcription factor domain-containing protein [Aspergillus unguis]